MQEEEANNSTTYHKTDDKIDYTNETEHIFNQHFPPDIFSSKFLFVNVAINLRKSLGTTISTNGKRQLSAINAQNQKGQCQNTTMKEKYKLSSPKIILGDVDVTLG